MIMGMTTLTLVHVMLSLVGIVSGFVVVYGLITAKRFDVWNAMFFLTTVLTSVTGFFFPFERFLPSHAIGLLSLLLLAVAILARYAHRPSGAWRLTYVISAVSALYFNVFVLIVQTFKQVPALKSLAPTQSEPPFLLTQIVALALFIAIGITAATRFQRQPAQHIVSV